MTYLDILRGQLRVDEGVRSKPYFDTEGKLTIGVGRNLDDVGLRSDEIALMLENDIAVAERAVRALVPTFDQLSDGRKAVLCNMAFNLGQTRLSGFRKMLAAVNAGRFGEAADEMRASKWAEQVKDRAERLATLMCRG